MLFNSWLLKLQMRKQDVKAADGPEHSATHSVRNYLSGHERCLVVWGLAESQTHRCALDIARGVIHERGLAKVWRCDEISRSQATIRNSFLEQIKCTTPDKFAVSYTHLTLPTIYSV